MGTDYGYAGNGPPPKVPPPSIFAGEQRLKTLETSPRLEDLEFIAAYPRNTESPLIRFIVDMAQTVSTFDATAK